MVITGMVDVFDSVNTNGHYTRCFDFAEELCVSYAAFVGAVSKTYALL